MRFLIRVMLLAFVVCTPVLALGIDQVLRWDCSTTSAPWTARISHASVVFNDRVWILAGLTGSGTTCDVWSSSDGVTWRQETASAEWGPRSSLRCTVHNGRMWVIGGQPSMGQWNDDVWSSENGANWQLERANRNVTGGGVVVTFGGKIWDIGGVPVRVWSSSDGINWVESVRTLPDPWPGPRNAHTSVVHNGRMWIMGGGYIESLPYPPGPQYTYYNDVWSTTDGTHWEKTTAAAQWQPRSGLGSVVRDGRIWILGGGRESDPSHPHFNDAWSSADGTTWTLESRGPWEGRWSHTAAFLSDRIFIMGGYPGYNDVWNYGWHDPLPPLKARAEWNLLSSENPRGSRLLPFAPALPPDRAAILVSAPRRSFPALRR